MNIIRKEPNPSGAYPSPQTWGNYPTPSEYDIIPDTIDLTDFYTVGGFVTPTIENEVWTGYATNTAAWESWQAENASVPQPQAEPTIEERTTALEATQSDVIDVLATTLGVTI